MKFRDESALRYDYYSRASQYGSMIFASGQTEDQNQTRTGRYARNSKSIGGKDQIGKKAQTRQKAQIGKS